MTVYVDSNISERLFESNVEADFSKLTATPELLHQTNDKSGLVDHLFYKVKSKWRLQIFDYAFGSTPVKIGV